jgi:hypothetical protein
LPLPLRQTRPQRGSDRDNADNSPFQFNENSQRELEQSRSETAERQEALGIVNDELAAIESEIDNLLSENPRDFVLRFIQTVGQ